MENDTPLTKTDRYDFHVSGLACWSARDGVPVLKNPAGRRRRPFQYYSCTARGRKSSRPPATAVSVLKLYYQRTKIQPAAGDDRFSTKVVLPEDENPAGRRRRPVQVLQLYYQRMTSSRPPATAVSVLKLYYQRTKIQPAADDCTTVVLQRARIQPAAGDGRSSIKVVLLGNENLAGSWRSSSSQYFCILNKAQSQNVENDTRLTKIQCTNPRPETKPYLVYHIPFKWSSGPYLDDRET